MCKRFKKEKRKDKLNSKITTKGSPFSSKKIKKNNSEIYIYPQKGDQGIDNEINTYTPKTSKEIISKIKTIPPNSEQEIIKEKKNCPQTIIQVVEKKINSFEIETSLTTKGNNQYDSKIKEKYLIKDENMITQNKKVQVIGVNNNIPSSQNVQEMKNVFINSPKEYGENLLKRINIFFIFCSI